MITNVTRAIQPVKSKRVMNAMRFRSGYHTRLIFRGRITTLISLKTISRITMLIALTAGIYSIGIGSYWLAAINIAISLYLLYQLCTYPIFK